MPVIDRSIHGLYDELLNHDSLKNEIDFLLVLFE